jgi:ABC-type arginine transport system ATPase subunit
MYMPKPHDHTKWQAAKDEKKAQAKERRGQKDKKNASGTTPATTASGKLTLAKNLVEALTTQVGVSDADAKKLAEDILSKSKA